MLELEKMKFCYRYLNDALPPNIVYCIGTDPNGNSLIKTHRYNTRNQMVPKKPKVNYSAYKKSIFCTYSTLPANIKQSKSLSQFIQQCTHWLKNH